MNNPSCETNSQPDPLQAKMQHPTSCAKAASSHYPSPPMNFLDHSHQESSGASQAISREIRDLVEFPKQQKQQRGRRGIPKGPCVNCGITTSPFWRRDPDGRFNCNACGLYRKYQNKARPITLNRAPRKRRSIEPSPPPSGHVRSTSSSSEGRIQKRFDQATSRRYSSGIDILCNAVANHQVSRSAKKLPSLKNFLMNLGMEPIMRMDLGKQKRRAMAHSLISRPSSFRYAPK
jgi:hypothetical protein